MFFNVQSFKSLEKWQDEFLVAAAPSDPLNFPFVIMGNKVDVPESERKVTKEEVEEWSKARRPTVALCVWCYVGNALLRNECKGEHQY